MKIQGPKFVLGHLEEIEVVHGASREVEEGRERSQNAFPFVAQPFLSTHLFFPN